MYINLLWQLNDGRLPSLSTESDANYTIIASVVLQNRLKGLHSLSLASPDVLANVNEVI